jgi:NTE family protein
MFKKLFYLIPFLAYLMCYSQIKENLVIPKNPKIGLSLSGGGAKVSHTLVF